ncbi:hypothetical protein PQC31_gp55 [Pseudomonas phage Iggy]|uniref:DUF669 domain-containing protein n=2 Tax=Iggyvirus TaxID=3044738 RepID=A0A7S5EDN7_9CAUD|nr:hypothetical protein PQC31_gp55 [Pseudomonas phage Iggy]QEA09776.1 hypothetical protein [Pseudomonas phage Iggy]
MAQLNFNAQSVTPDTGIVDPIPAGWVVAQVTESDIKATQSGGARLATTFTVLQPQQYAGRKVFTGFNIKNDNPTAQEIAFKQLSALAHAVGVLQIQDSQQLHGIPLHIRLKVRPAKDGYEASNDITAYRSMSEPQKLVGEGSAVPGVAVPGSAPVMGGAPTMAPQMAPQMAMAQPAPMQQPQVTPAQVAQAQVTQPQVQVQPQVQAQPQVQQQQPQTMVDTSAQQPWAAQGAGQVAQQPMQQPMQAQQQPQQVQAQVQPQAQPQVQAQPQQAAVAQDPAAVAGAATPPWHNPQ